MVKFGSELCYEESFPFCVIKLVSRYASFVSCFTHRDFLGSILVLGIQRCKVGDVFAGKHEGYAVIHHDLK